MGVGNDLFSLGSRRCATHSFEMVVGVVGVERVGCDEGDGIIRLINTHIHTSTSRGDDRVLFLRVRVRLVRL